MIYSAAKALIDKRIERALKRARQRAARKADLNRKPTAAELARRYRREVLKKL